ncbi:MAG: hypothetical protein HKN44_06695 [Ilumatobacter sp.]|nr:hypothetical protein [Ilumatobacter sp.]
MGWELVFVIGIPLLTFGFIFLMRRVGKNMVGTSKADAAEIQRLQTLGRRARATLTSITPTGLTVNNFNVQCNVAFWLTPLDGSPPFEQHKKIFFLETQFPRQGDTWPAWYDPGDLTKFAVGSPGKLDPAQIPLYREFGIEHPLDTAPDY